MRFKTIPTLAAIVLVAGGLGLLAGWAAFAPPAVDQEQAPVQEYTVTEATVGREVSMTATAHWPSVSLAAGAADGTVTDVNVSAGQEVAAGVALFYVDLRPVVIAEGQTPSFRDLSRGADGPDVLQLQELLGELGHYSEAIDGEFGMATEGALKAWQRDLGVDDDGRLRAGDVQYASSLPARVLLTDDVQVGGLLTAGTVTTAVVAPEPDFELEFSDAAAVPTTGTTVRINGPDEHEWHAEVTEIRTDEEGGAPSGAILEAARNGAVCADACEAIPVDADTSRYPAAVELTPAYTGPVVPLSAIGTTPAGEEFVLSLDDERIDISILVADGSRAVVDGLAEGDQIRLFADDEASGEHGVELSPEPDDEGPARPDDELSHDSTTGG